MLVRLIMYLVIGFFAFLLVRRTLTRVSVRTAPRSDPERGVAQLVQDPQCGAYVDRAEAVQRRVPGGVLFYCSEKCAETHAHVRERDAAG